MDKKKLKNAKLLPSDSVINMLLNPSDYTKLFIAYQFTGIVIYHLEVIINYIHILILYLLFNLL